MNKDLETKVQAWVDGELDSAAARAVAQQVQADSQAQALSENLRQFSRFLQENPPARAVPETREFYWSQIRRRMDQAEAAASSRAVAERAGGRPWGWLAWALPAGAVALAAILILRPATDNQDSEDAGRAGTVASAAMIGHEVEAPSTSVTTLTFYSAEEAMTVVWVGQVDML
jgi:hypothetical protein